MCGMPASYFCIKAFSETGLNGWPEEDGYATLFLHGDDDQIVSIADSAMLVYTYVTLGYAVVATDYAGLGTEGRHAYLDMLSNGTDVIKEISWTGSRPGLPQNRRQVIIPRHDDGQADKMIIFAYR